MPEITVVISAYNLEKYIAGCLGQLEAQSFRDFDVLIIDDCSTDGTYGIIENYSGSLSDRLRFMRTPSNTGSPGKTRNYALDSGMIDGRYVLFLDGDDRIEPVLLERLHSAAENDGSDIVICAYDRFEDGSGHVLCREMQGFPPVVDIPPDSDILAFVNGSLWNKLIRTGIIGGRRIPDIKVGEDMIFSFYLYGRSARISFTDEILIHYRVHDRSVMSNTDDKAIRDLSGEISGLLSENSADRELYEVTALVAFIHIGISMALRAYDNADIDNREFLARNKRYLKENGILKGRKYLRLSSLIRHGIRGLAIYICLLCYRAGGSKAGGMHFFLILYNAAKKLLGIDVKF